MNLNIEKLIKIYLKDEISELNSYPLILDIKKIAEEKGLNYKCEAGLRKDGTRQVTFIDVCVNNEKNELIMIFDEGCLSAYTEIIALDKQDRLKFSSWKDDNDFIESLEWIKNELNKIENM